MTLTTEQNDRLIAAADLVGRSGGTHFEVGHDGEDDQDRTATWWATARYKGALLMVDSKRDPIEASEALARRILANARCAHCDRIVQIGEPWDTPSPFRMGRRPRRCVWTRRGPRWEMGCTPTGGTQ